MFQVVLVGAALTAVVLAGQSPHADEVARLQNSPDGSRFSTDVFEDARLDIEGLLRKYQYPLEVHTVVTSDGYILTTHRIPHGRDNNNQPGPRPVVLVMHGLLSSSADFLVLGPGNALGYILAEEGYDVWLLNARGNYFSRNHTTLNPDRRGDSEFWMFTWEEIGRLDLPAYIDYILETTGQDKVHYVGHSQGGTSILVLTSMIPEYNEKFISFQGLAPAAYQRFNEDPLYVTLSQYERTLDALARQIGIGEVLAKSDILSFITYNYCRDGSAFQPICRFYFINEESANYFNSTMLPVFLGHAPAGAAFRQVLHYAQSIKYGTFSRYNFGSLQNLYSYGRVTPPPYDMSRVTVRTYLHYGLNDAETDYRDILYLEEVLPNAIALQAPRPSFTHYDFIWGVDVKEQVYDTVLVMMREAERID